MDLDSFDCGADSCHTYDFKGLPEVEFTCYLRLDHPLPLQGSHKKFKSEKNCLEMKLVDEENAIFSEAATIEKLDMVGNSRCIEK